MTRGVARHFSGGVTRKKKSPGFAKKLQMFSPNCQKCQMFSRVCQILTNVLPKLPKLTNVFLGLPKMKKVLPIMDNFQRLVSRDVICSKVALNIIIFTIRLPIMKLNNIGRGNQYLGFHAKASLKISTLLMPSLFGSLGEKIPRSK